MPRAMRQGVLGIARITGTPGPTTASMLSVVTPVAIEITSTLPESAGRIASATFETPEGFTHRITTSASRAASRFEVPMLICKLSRSSCACSLCFTVPRRWLRSTAPLSISERRIRLPILPAPSTATVLPRNCPEFSLDTISLKLVLLHGRSRTRREHFIPFPRSWRVAKRSLGGSSRSQPSTSRFSNSSTPQAGSAFQVASRNRRGLQRKSLGVNPVKLF